MVTSKFDHAKWRWKMEFCKKKHIPPAQDWAWNKAEEAYQWYLRAKDLLGE